MTRRARPGLGPRHWLLLAAILLQACVASAAWADGSLRLVVGPAGSSQERIGRDFARYVAAPAGIELEVVTSDGPAHVLQQLRDHARRSDGMQLALLQSDVAQAYLSAAARGRADAAEWLAPLRVVLPLYREELYFIVRSDAPFRSLRDIRDARINIGSLTGGTAFATTTLYRLLFDAPLPAGRVSHLGNEEALKRLLVAGSVDVVALMSEPPARLLANMKPEAQRFVRLLAFDGDEAALQAYDAVALTSARYPNLLAADVPGLAARVYLVAHGYRPGEDDELLARLVRTWCANRGLLQEVGDAGWRETGVERLPLKAGWQYAEPAAAELDRCGAVGR